MASKLPTDFDHLIPDVRQSVRASIDSLSEEDRRAKYYKADLIELENSDYEVRRFLVASNGKENMAVQKILHALQWKKEMQVRELRDDSFPLEFWAIGGMFAYEPDRNGRKVLHFRMRVCVSCRELITTIKRFLTYTAWKMDRAAGELGFTVVVDLKGISFENCDLEMAKHTVALDAAFPHGIRKVLAVDCPALIRAAWWALLLVVPNERKALMTMVNQQELRNYVAPENLPGYLGGSCSRQFCGPSVVPVGAPSFTDFAADHLNITSDRFQIMNAKYQPLMCEAENLSGDKIIMP